MVKIAPYKKPGSLFCHNWYCRESADNLTLIVPYLIQNCTVTSLHQHEFPLSAPCFLEFRHWNGCRLFCVISSATKSSVHPIYSHHPWPKMEKKKPRRNRVLNSTPWLRPSVPKDIETGMILSFVSRICMYFPCK